MRRPCETAVEQPRLRFMPTKNVKFHHSVIYYSISTQRGTRQIAGFICVWKKSVVAQTNKVTCSFK